MVIAAALADVVQKQPLPLPQPAVNKHGAQGTLTGQPSQVKPQPLPAKVSFLLSILHSLSIKKSYDFTHFIFDKKKLITTI